MAVRIAMVSGPASPLTPEEGLGRYVADLATVLAGRGHRVTVYTRRDSRKQPDRVRLAPRLDVEHVPAGPAKPVHTDRLAPHMGRFGELLAQRWRADRPDVVHAHSWLSGMAALAAGSEGTTPPVVVSYDALGAILARHCDGGGHDERVELERRLGRQAAKVTVSSSEGRLELVRMGVPRADITVVPAGVDHDQFSPRPLAETGGGPPRLVSAGPLEPRYGHDTVIAALARMADAELVIAGGPPANRLKVHPEARRLRELAKTLGVADRVRLLGQVPRADMPALLRSASVGVCAPWYEPFGTVALRAMACAVPVVAAAVGCLTDVVVHGVTGLNVPPRRPDALAAAIRSLLADPTSREAFGLAGYDRVHACYSWDRVADDMLRVYEAAMALPVEACAAPRSHDAAHAS